MADKIDKVSTLISADSLARHTITLGTGRETELD